MLVVLDVLLWLVANLVVAVYATATPVLLPRAGHSTVGGPDRLLRAHLRLRRRPPRPAHELVEDVVESKLKALRNLPRLDGTITSPESTAFARCSGGRLKVMPERNPPLKIGGSRFKGSLGPDSAASPLAHSVLSGLAALINSHSETWSAKGSCAPEVQSLRIRAAFKPGFGCQVGSPSS